MRLKLEFCQTHIQTLLPADFLLHPVNSYHKTEKEGRRIKVSFLFLFSLVSVDLTLDVYYCLWLLLALAEPAVSHLSEIQLVARCCPFTGPWISFSEIFRFLSSLGKYCLFRGLSPSQLAKVSLF